MWRTVFKRKRNIVLILMMIAMPLVAPLVTAQTEFVQQAATTTSELKFVGAALAVGISGLGAGIAVSGATSAGLAAMVERPEMTTWVIIFAALGEGIAIYGLVISIIILGS